jgi:hypothetical protein
MTEPTTLPLDEIVRQFLTCALIEPEKPPKTQRAQRENRMLVLGFNRAQENLRTILANLGDTDEVRALADVRTEQQERPLDIGGQKVWVAS